MISELIYKKGHCFYENKRQPLNDNNMVEKTFGKLGIICIEDII
jgi:large subunit ribosomal protein L7e